MDTTISLLSRILDRPEIADLKSIEAKAGLKSQKGKVASFFIEYKKRILDILVNATSVDQQLSLVKAITLALTRRQVLEQYMFGTCTVDIVGKGRLAIRELLLRFNQSYGGPIVCCRITRLVSHFKPLTLEGGILFMGSDHMKIYGQEHTVVVFYKSVLGMNKIAKTTWEINAQDSKRVVIEFADDAGYGKVEERIASMYCGNELETEDSITLSIEDYQNGRLVTEEEVAAAISSTGLLTGPEYQERARTSVDRSADEAVKEPVLPKQQGSNAVESPRFEAAPIKTVQTADPGPARRVTFSMADNTVHGIASIKDGSKEPSTEIESDSSSQSIKCKSKQQTPRAASKRPSRPSAFQCSPVLSKKVVKKIMKIYKTRLLYNKAIYQELNRQAVSFKNRMLRLKNATVYLLKKDFL